MSTWCVDIRNKCLLYMIGFHVIIIHNIHVFYIIKLIYYITTFYILHDMKSCMNVFEDVEGAFLVCISSNCEAVK